MSTPSLLKASINELEYSTAKLPVPAPVAAPVIPPTTVPTTGTALPASAPTFIPASIPPSAGIELTKLVITVSAIACGLLRTAPNDPKNPFVSCISFMPSLTPGAIYILLISLTSSAIDSAVSLSDIRPN